MPVPRELVELVVFCCFICPFFHSFENVYVNVLSMSFVKVFSPLSQDLYKFSDPPGSRMAIHVRTAGLLFVLTDRLESKCTLTDSYS